MADPIYTSKVRIEKLEGSHRKAFISPFEDEPVEFGVHSEIAEHYGGASGEPLPTTLDHVVAAAGG